MTAPLDPNQTFTYWLPEDAGLPEAQRRGLICRYMTVREWMQFNEKYDASKLKPFDEQIAEITCALGMCVIGLKHPTLQWIGPTSLLDAFTEATLIWLCVGELREAAMLTEIERKKSARQLQSSTAASAPTASLTLASAQSAPAQASPLNSVVPNVRKVAQHV